MLRITNYATASTDSAAYIIGGYLENRDSVTDIAEFKNGKWRKIGNLNEPKRDLSAILYNGEYMLVGGYLKSLSGR